MRPVLYTNAYAKSKEETIVEIDNFTEQSAKKAEEPAEDIPDVDEATVGQLSEEVRVKRFWRSSWDGVGRC